MGSLARFLALPPAERRLIVAATGLLAAARVGLWVLPFRWVHRASGAVANRPRPRGGGGPSVERIVWAEAPPGRAATTCLVRALAAQALLAHRGHASQLRLGVAGGSGRAFEAHAWLERDGDPDRQPCRSALRSLAGADPQR
jgi:hypothetical protein